MGVCGGTQNLAPSIVILKKTKKNTRTEIEQRCRYSGIAGIVLSGRLLVVFSVLLCCVFFRANKLSLSHGSRLASCGYDFDNFVVLHIE